MNNEMKKEIRRIEKASQKETMQIVKRLMADNKETLKLLRH